MGCVRAYQGNPPAWSDCIDLGLGGSEGSISSFDCNAKVFSPATATMGAAYNGYLYLPYTGGNGGRYPEDDFTVAGLTFHLPEGTYNTGSGSLTYQVTGTPTASGTISVDINQNGASCTGLSFTVNPPVGTVTALTCASVAFAPATTTMGVPYTGTLAVPYTGGTGGTYAAQSFSTNGLTFTLAAGTFASGSGSVTYNISGTPTTSGATSVNITLGGGSCTGAGNLTVNNAPPANPVGTGSLSGKTCFDVVQTNDGGSCGTRLSRTSQRTDFTTAANTQIYTFTPTGTVSNVRFSFINTNGQVIQSITGGNTGNVSAAINATVVYYNNLNTVAAGLSREQALLADIYVVYNNAAVGGGGSDRQLKLTARVQDCNCCGAKISSTVWKEFLCHNLGADITADPFAPSWRLNGAYIQWGRRGPNTTGDSRIDWQTAPNDGLLGFAAAPTATDPKAGAVSAWIGFLPYYYAWNLGTEAAPVKNTLNDPCPAGYRLPSLTEMQGVVANNNRSRIASWSTSNTAYVSAVRYGPSSTETTLMLHTAGLRDDNGAIYTNVHGRGSSAAIWTLSTPSSNSGSGTYFIESASSSNASQGNTSHANGVSMPVRCIAQ